MRVNIDGRIYDVVFSYHEVLSKGSDTPVIQTLCKISLVNPEKRGKEAYTGITSGCATQHPRDQFNRSKGRRKALEHALGHMYYRSLDFNDVKRKKSLFWAEYFKNCDKKIFVANKKERKQIRDMKKSVKQYVAIDELVEKNGP